VIEPDQTLRTLPGNGLALGVDPHATYLNNERLLMPGNALVLYTDGLVEARRDYIEGMRLLEAAIAAETRNPALNMADGIQLRVFDGLSPHDDSAVLVVTIVLPGAGGPTLQKSGTTVA
jgi:phosphoserine phosphatase RsbU/P